MANQNLFKTIAGKLMPRTDAKNREGAGAYRYDARHALVQYAATGCLNRTFYSEADEQLAEVLELCSQLSPEFIGQVAVYAREEGRMKDLPALLCAVLAARSPETLKKVFPRVIDNGKMLRTFVQIVRSGAVGRKSFGTALKRLIQAWLEGRGETELLMDSVGQSPSLADVIKMVHPKPKDPRREALYGYFVGKTKNVDALPELIWELEVFKMGAGKLPRQVPFQLLTSLDLSREDWVEIARQAPWNMTRMNLNTFARHGVFEHYGMTELVASRLRDRALVERARAFPYQLLMAYLASGQAGSRVPNEVRDALQDAMEIALSNVPELAGEVVVCPDVSGSMRSPVTGERKGASSAVRCVDVAALVAAALVRKNPKTLVLPFEEKVVDVAVNGRDSVMTNAQRLAAVGGGGTNCSAPLRLLNQRRARAQLVVFVSDNQSWVDARGAGHPGTAMLEEWNKYRARVPGAKLVCIDIQPYGTTQAKDREDILNVGGFSDQVFSLVRDFADGSMGNGNWVRAVERIAL